MHASHVEHFRGQCNSQLNNISGATTCKNLNRFANLIGITNGQTQRNIHIGQQRCGVHAGICAEGNHGAGQLTRTFYVFEESARAELHIEHEAVSSFSNLLTHDAGSNQGNCFHGCGDVTQGIELAVGRSQARTCSTDHSIELS